MRGRKPKPTAVKAIDGNPGKRALNLEEPIPPPMDATYDGPPDDLGDNPIAIREWERLAPMLRRCKQITVADRSALVAVCLEWARYIEATKKVRDGGLIVKTPTGYPMPNPYLSIATKALAGCNKLWPELGLTPSSRSRVKAEGGGIEADAFSEFDHPPEIQAGTKH